MYDIISRAHVLASLLIDVSESGVLSRCSLDFDHVDTKNGSPLCRVYVRGEGANEWLLRFASLGEHFLRHQFQGSKV